MIVGDYIAIGTKDYTRSCSGMGCWLKEIGVIDPFGEDGDNRGHDTLYDYVG